MLPAWYAGFEPQNSSCLWDFRSFYAAGSYSLSQGPLFKKHIPMARICWPIGACSFSSTSRVNIVASVFKWSTCDWCDQCYVPSVLCYVCSVSVIKAVYPNIHGNFILIIIEININPDIVINNNLILPIFCRAFIYWIIIIYYWIIIIYYRIIITLL